MESTRNIDGPCLSADQQSTHRIHRIHRIHSLRVSSKGQLAHTYPASVQGPLSLIELSLR